jgi:TonB family protein
MRHFIFFICLVTAMGAWAQAEVPPVFGNCNAVQAQRECSDKAVVAFLSKQLKYPAIARENGIQGTVVVKFTVNKDGSTSDYQLVRDIGGGCGQEAIRVIQAMEGWKPGMTSGKPVSSVMTLPIKFKLETETSASSQYTLFLGAYTSERLTGKELAEALQSPITIRDAAGSLVKVQELSLTIEKRGKSLSATTQGDQPSKEMRRMAKKAKKGGSALIEARVMQGGASHTVQRSIAIQ